MLVATYREVIEMLYDKNILRLIATETFAIGLNMPTRSVVLLHFSNMTVFNFANFVVMNLFKWLVEQVGEILIRKEMLLFCLIHLNH